MINKNIYKNPIALIISISCILLSTQCFAGSGKSGSGGSRGIDNRGKNYSSQQQNRNKERIRYKNQNGQGNRRDQDSNQINLDQNIQQNKTRFQTPVTKTNQ